MAEQKRFSLISADSLNLFLNKNKSNATDMSKLAEQLRSKLDTSKTSKIIKLLKSVINEHTELLSKVPEIEKSTQKINEALDLLVGEDELFDESTIYDNQSDMKSDELTEGLDLLKTYSNNYSNQIKTQNLVKISQSNKKYTQTFNNTRNNKRNSILEPIQEKEENKRSSLKKLSNAIKMSDKLTKVFSFDFNIFDADETLNHKTMAIISTYVFTQMNYFENNLINEDIYSKFIEELTNGYSRNVLYHNDLHAIDVFQTVSNFIHHSDIGEVRIYYIFIY